MVKALHRGFGDNPKIRSLSTWTNERLPWHRFALGECFYSCYYYYYYYYTFKTHWMSVLCSVLQRADKHPSMHHRSKARILMAIGHNS